MGCYKEKEYRIGDIYLMDFRGDKNEQCGVRPGLIFQNNAGNTHSPNIIALPLTTAIKKEAQPTHVTIYASDTRLLYDSMVLCENPVCVSKSRIMRYIDHLPDSYMADIAIANLLSSSAISYVKPTELLVAWRKAVRLNDRK